MPDSTVEALLSDPVISADVEQVWNKVSAEFDKVNARKFHRYMERHEISFHTDVKLLGYLVRSLRELEGDVLEIGVWKGKTLTFIDHLVGVPHQTIGIDPLEVDGQVDEVAYLQKRLFPDITVIRSYSEDGVDQVVAKSQRFKLLHIDGGHFARNVWLDFLVYERFVVPGGYLVIDDYGDHEFCPEVGPTVDRLHELGLFADYEIIGQVQPFPNGYVLRRKA
jgi:hypothetical protein